MILPIYCRIFTQMIFVYAEPIMKWMHKRVIPHTSCWKKVADFYHPIPMKKKIKERQHNIDEVVKQKTCQQLVSVLKELSTAITMEVKGGLLYVCGYNS